MTETWAASATNGPDLAGVQKQVVQLANRFRADQGRSVLNVDPQLNAAAQRFAEYMARTDEYGHEADGQTPAERAEAAEYDICLIAENLAWQSTTGEFGTRELARRFVTGWEESPGHRRNLLDPDVTETGVGVAHSAESGRYYAVHMFGRPQSAAIRFQVSNEAGSTIEYEVGGQTFTLPPRTTRTHLQCRPSDLEFLATETARPAASVRTVQPESGDRFTVVRDRSGNYAVQRERNVEMESPPLDSSER